MLAVDKNASETIIPSIRGCSPLDSCFFEFRIHCIEKFCEISGTVCSFFVLVVKGQIIFGES